MQEKPPPGQTPIEHLRDSYMAVISKLPQGIGSQSLNVGTLPEYQNAPAFLDRETGFGLALVKVSAEPPMVCAFRMEVLDKGDVHIAAFKPATIIQNYRTAKEGLIDLVTMLAHTRIRDIVG